MESAQAQVIINAGIQIIVIVITIITTITTITIIVCTITMMIMTILQRWQLQIRTKWGRPKLKSSQKPIFKSLS